MPQPPNTDAVDAVNQLSSQLQLFLREHKRIELTVKEAIMVRTLRIIANITQEQYRSLSPLIQDAFNDDTAQIISALDELRPSYTSDVVQTDTIDSMINVLREELQRCNDAYNRMKASAKESVAQQEASTPEHDNPTLSPVSLSPERLQPQTLEESSLDFQKEIDSLEQQLRQYEEKLLAKLFSPIESSVAELENAVSLHKVCIFILHLITLFMSFL